MSDASLAAPVEEPRHLERRALWWRSFAFAAVLLATLWPRLAGLRVVFARGELMQWDGDSAYHLKRILHALAHFPELPRFDPSMNWPAGAPCPWPDGFDLLAASWGLLAGLGSPERATMAVLLFTPLLGLLAVWAAIDLARLVVPDGPAKEGAVLSTGLLMAVVPASVNFSQVGFLDHHIAELLAFLLLAGWAMRRIPSPQDSAARSWIAWELGGAFAATFAVWIFAGGVLYIAIAFAVVLVGLLRDERPGIIGSGLPAMAAAAAAAALLNLPSLGAHGRTFSYQFPSMVQPLLVAGAALALALALLTTRLAGSFARRLALLAFFGACGAALAAALFLPALVEVRAGIEGWLLRRDPWIASVVEFQPFGWNAPTFLAALFAAYGSIGVSAPLLLVAGGWVAIRAARGRGVAFVILSTGFVLMTLHQVRFERIGQPLLMINAAAVMAAFAHRKRSHPQLTAVRAFPVLVTAVLIVADPVLLSSLKSTRIRLPPGASVGIALRGLAADLPGTGVLTPWDQGHIVSVMSGLPTPTNGFGSYLDPATFLESEEVFLRDGAALDAFLERRRLSFVVYGALVGGLKQRNFYVYTSDGKALVLDLEYMRSFPLTPLLIGGSAIPDSGVKHLERLMPVFGTREQAAGLSFALPALWVYERVPGAHVVGNAPSGRRVVASLDFREQGRPHVWRAFADAGPGGDYELIIPFPTSVVRPGLSSGPRYALRVGDGPVTEVAVPEGTVRTGGTVRAGEVRAGTR